jgi:hypothetical protein
MIELLRFSHDREVPFKQSCDALRDIIDAFAEQPELEDWYNHFEKCYSLPNDVVKQQLKQCLERKYDYATSKFDHRLSVKDGIKATIKHIGFLMYALINSKRRKNGFNKYELIIDGVTSKEEYQLFSRLINLFGKENVLIITEIFLVDNNHNIIYRPPHKLYELTETVRTFIKEIINGLKIYRRLSRKLNINLIPIASSILVHYLYFYNIFKYNRSKYCIQERYRSTSAVKNFLFHKFGGIHSCCLQRNILPLGRNGFYYDIDVFFVLGKRTADRPLKYGAKIKQIVPVGSLCMERDWFNNRSKCDSPEKSDIVYIGGNFGNMNPSIDSSSSFKPDYYKSFRWLVEISKEYPHLKIGIKHHSNNEVDEREMEIINNSNVMRINQKLNSYEVAFHSKCAVTFCSTMGYELLAHGVPVFYLDPGRRSQFLPDDDLLDNWRIITYDELRNKVESHLSIQSFEKGGQFSKDDLCLQSNSVSERIYTWLVKKNRGFNNIE